MANGNNHDPRWLYDPGEGRYKHKWNRDEAGFDPSGKGPVGKCPNTMTREIAQQLLNDGLEVWEDGDVRASLRGESREFKKWMKKFGGP